MLIICSVQFICTVVCSIQATSCSKQCVVYVVRWHCALYIELCAVYIVYYIAYSAQGTVHSVNCDRNTVNSVQCTMYSVQYTMYSVQCTMYSVQCTVHIIECRVCSGPASSTPLPQSLPEAGEILTSERPRGRDEHLGHRGSNEHLSSCYVPGELVDSF